MTTATDRRCLDCGEEMDSRYTHHTGCCPHADVDSDTSDADNGIRYLWSMCLDCGADVILTPDGWEAI